MKAMCINSSKVTELKFFKNSRYHQWAWTMGRMIWMDWHQIVGVVSTPIENMHCDIQTLVTMFLPSH
eukprot:5254337-Amphidinium_carterae.1